MKTQLLDPLGTLCKLIALNFNKIKTKMSIHNHILTLQKPDNYQSILRLYYGDGKENVSELYYVIIRIIKWYLVPHYSTTVNEIQGENNDNSENDEKIEIIMEDKNNNAIDISKSQNLRKMIKYLCNGFTKLQETYEYGNVVLSLQYFINLLEDGLTGHYADNKLPKYVLEKDQEYENLLDYDKLKNLWECQTLDKICELYDNCFNLMNDNYLSKETRDALINGYLLSIDAILEIKDNAFQTLIQNSNKG
ncbi:Hypothetical protein KVN_LOCUS545 [uncultured virus]|nr:Hypothetical protein KVN_LOCUS545 [uncultured virus]